MLQCRGSDQTSSYSSAVVCVHTSPPPLYFDICRGLSLHERIRSGLLAYTLCPTVIHHLLKLYLKKAAKLCLLSVLVA